MDKVQKNIIPTIKLVFAVYWYWNALFAKVVWLFFEQWNGNVHFSCIHLCSENQNAYISNQGVILWTILCKFRAVSLKQDCQHCYGVDKYKMISQKKWVMFLLKFSCQWKAPKLMQGALDSSSGRARCNNTAASASSSSASVLALLQTVCTNPVAIHGSVDSHNQSTQPYACANLTETVVKQLLQLATTSPSATSTSTAYHVTGAGSPLKNGVRACTCIVHLVLLQVWLGQDPHAFGRNVLKSRS
jgi:hypothetical protein